MSTEAIVLLRSIDASLKELVAVARAHRSGGSSAVATDRDLDSPHGDPLVRFHPRDWDGPDCKGLRFSQCSADFLDLMAESLAYFATKADEKGETTAAGKSVGDYKRKDAARARGWAARIRSGKVADQPTNGAADPEWDARGF